MKQKQMSFDDSIVQIEKALLSGHKLHTFRSGGGLQVVRIDAKSVLKGYGEHPHINEALRHAGEDFAAGGRPYADVYGKIDWDNPEKSKQGLYSMYLTGTHEINGKLDEWVKQNTLRARGFHKQIEIELRGWGELVTPQDIVERCTKNKEIVEWEDTRGCKFISHPSIFPGDRSPGCSTSLQSCPPNMPKNAVWIWETKQTGRGASFADALNAAFIAKVEIINEDT